MPRFEPAGAIEAHKTDDGREYLLRLDGTFIGVLDAELFDRVFRPAAERRVAAAGNDTAAVAVEAGRSHPIIPPEPYVPGSERLATALAARTNGDGPAHRVVTDPLEVERIIEETRAQVEASPDPMDEMSQARAYKRAAATPAKPGKGKKVCKKCHEVNNAGAKACGTCGKAF